MVGKLHVLLEQQTVITEILQQLQATDNLRETIHWIISYLGKYIHASAVTIFENSPDGNLTSNTFEWCDEGVKPTIDQFQSVPWEQFPTSRTQFTKDKILCVNSFDDLPQEIKNIFPYYEHTSILFVRMEHNGKEMGFLNANRTSGIPWSDSEIAFIRKATGVLAAAVLRIRMEEAIMAQSTALRESENRFRTIVQQLSDLIVIVDAQGFINYISPAGTRMLGYAPEEVIGTNIFKYVHPDDLDNAMIEMEKTLQEDISDDVLPDLVFFRIINAWGETIMLEGVGRNAFSNGSINGMILTFKDVTQQRAAEQKVQENLEKQQLLSRILQELHYTTDVGISLQHILTWIAEYTHLCTVMLMHWDTDSAGHPLLVTWQSSELPVEHEKGFHIPSNMFVKWAEQIKNDLVLVYDFEHLHDFIKPYYSKNAVKRLYAFPFAQHGRTCGMMVLTQCSINREATDWGYNEVTFIQSIAQIISNSLERETAQKNLVKAKEHAEEADNLKSAFLANMSHEIRTPMNGIVGFASLIQREETSPKVAQYAQIINDNCQMLLQLLDDIVDISKLESGQMKMSPANCNINQLLADQLLLYKQLFKKKGKDKVEMILDENGLDETVYVDPVRLQQVLTNLVGNAIKFTDKGYIRFGYKKTDDHHLLFYVKDSGIGIPESHFEIIFERFRQVEEHREQNIGGTGLGLSISKSLVKMMNGKIWVESQLNVGTEFYFTINSEN